MTDDAKALYPIEIDLDPRALRVVFFVPEENTELAHRILDAVFQTAYSAWNGGYYLPNDGRPAAPYWKWMAAIDPDWIYMQALTKIWNK